MARSDIRQSPVYDLGMKMFVHSTLLAGAVGLVAVASCSSSSTSSSAGDASPSTSSDATSGEQPDSSVGADTPATQDDAGATPGEDTGAVVEGKTCTGDFVIETAADVQLIAGCTLVTGTVSVQAPDLTDMSGFASLMVIDGDLIIGGELPALSTFIDGPVSVGPAQLKSLAGLERLQRVGGQLRVGTSVDVFTGVHQETGSVTVGPVLLSSLHGLEGLEEIGSLTIGQLVRGNTTNVKSTLDLSHVSALDGVVVRGDVRLLHLPKLTALPGVVLPASYRLIVESVPLTTLVGPAWPEALASLWLIDTDLPSLVGLENVTKVGELTLDRNVKLSDFDDLGASTIDRVNIGELATPAQTALRVTTITSELLTWGHLSPFANLETVGSVDLREGFGDLSLNGLGALRKAGYLRLVTLADPDLSGLASLEEVGALTIGGSVKSLQGLPKGVKVQSLEIMHTTSLASLHGLEDVVLVAGALSPDEQATPSLGIGSNAELTSLEPISGWKPVNAHISGNPKLPQCLVDTFLAEAGLPTEGSSNRPFCTCELGVATCPYELCTFSSTGEGEGAGGQGEEPGLQDATCLVQADIVPSGHFVLPKLVIAMDVYIATTANSISLPALEQAQSLSIMGDGQGLGPMPITSISLPLLQNVGHLRIGGPNVPCPQLATVDLSSLETAKFLRIDCAGPTSSLTTLEFPKLTSVDFFYLGGCRHVARCAIEAQLAGVNVGEKILENLDDKCTCDGSGAVVPGSCGP